ncbi:MAG: TonB-dependent receptor [Mangrovibacterium sp.]
MKKNEWWHGFAVKKSVFLILRKMKLTILLICISILSSFGSGYSQNSNLNLKLKNLSLKAVLAEIENQTDYSFLYKADMINHDQIVNVDVSNASVSQILDILAQKTGFSYKIMDNSIIVLTSANEQPVQIQQQIRITGKVTDSSGAPLPGVSVVIKRTTQGTITDATGSYSLINIPLDATLVFSFVGMKMQETAVAGKTVINVVMQEETVGIEEVVAIAYGTQKRSELTGSISSVGIDDLEDMPMTQLGEKLQGKLPGVRIYQTEGIPGQGMTFRIRGQASINAGNSPLVVIDGFPSSTGLEAINPNEIETISVLKDASATSLYGSRAANGVILVTTKQAKEGKTEISLNVYTGIQNVPHRGRPDVMNARQFAEYKNQWYSDQGMEVPERYRNPEQYGPGDGTDWFEILLNKNALAQNYDLALSTGTAKAKSAINVSYNKQEGVLINGVAERVTARANNTFNVSEDLTIGLNVASIYRKSDNIDYAPAYWSTVSSAYIMDPTLEYKNEDGTLPIGFSSPGMFPNPNWYRVLKERENPTQRTNLLVNAFAEYEFIDGLKYKLKADADVGNSKNRYWSPSTAQGAMFSSPPNPATGSYNTSNYLNWQLENTLNYIKSFNGKHNFEILLGYSAQKVTSESSSITGSQFPDDEISWITGAPSGSRLGNASLSEFSVLSSFGRLNYNYKSKYLVSFAVRRDGSSRFGDNKKYGVFPSISAGWVVSQENFIRAFDKISFLKLRGSYGEVGNYNIGNYSHLSSIGNANYVFNNSVRVGKTKSNLGNSLLTWETTVQGDVGLDLGLFKDRVFFAYDYYWKTTNGLLYAVDIPLASGFGSIQSNIGEFEFWGHEFSLETRNFTGDFKWNTQLTFGLDRNLVKKLGTNDTPIGGYNENSDFNRTEVGHPIGQFYGYVYEGVFMNEAELAKGPWITVYGGSDVGSVRLKDISGPDGVPDGYVDPVNDKTFIGDPNPDFTFGFTNQFSYKNFDLSIHLLGRVGGDVFKGDLLSIENIDGVFNVRPAALDRWRSIENPGKGDLPRSNSNPLHRFNNTRHIFDGSYLSAKNIVLGYTFPFKSDFVIRSARIYVSSQNAFIITDYPGPNPEASQNGLNGLSEGRDFAPYPVPRAFTIGADINF